MRVRFWILGVALGLCSLRVAAGESEDWFDSGRETVARARERLGRSADLRARNAILFVGDGMDVTTVSAARIHAGQLRGETGEEGWLAFERFPHTALVKTYNTDQQTPDSAGTMTAMVTGVKTRAGLLSIGPAVARGDAEQAPLHRLETLLERAEARGLATGVVTTTRLTHATPAATYAHVPERDWEDDADLPEAVRASGFPDIARQLVEMSAGDGLEVAMGGGWSSFLPAPRVDPERDRENPPGAGPPTTGERLDGRDLTAEWAARPGAAYVWNARQLAELDLTRTRRLLGLFAPSHMRFEVDRAQDTAPEPSLAEMTDAALGLLQSHPDGRDKGWLLVVEAGRIDHAHHIGNAARALGDTVELSRAIEAALARVDPSDTLILVTADHGHTLGFAGYPTRGNPILGLVNENGETGEPTGKPALDRSGLPYTTLSYANGLGAQAPRRDLSAVDTTTVDFQQDALIPTRLETHGGQDVPAYAAGPGAPLVAGVIEQHVIYHILAHALGLDRPEPRGFWSDWF